MAKIQKYTIIVKDSDGNKLVTGEIDQEDFDMELTHDLDGAPNFLGNFLPAELYSKGTFISLTGYIKNKYAGRDMKKAMAKNAKNVGGGRR